MSETLRRLYFERFDYGDCGRSVASPKICGGSKMFDFKTHNTTLFGIPPHKAQMTICYRNLGVHGPLSTTLSTPMDCRVSRLNIWRMQKSFHSVLVLNVFSLERMIFQEGPINILHRVAESQRVVVFLVDKNYSNSESPIKSFFISHS